ncbi:(R)-phenoxypropionate/alpha-ketoglutarate-dioxygenase [Ascidiaceihabitans donghaensis]|uniref:(R)-phenoxypropionate/alpha-ketoglutarate-dioxygenase n=1 Tax=Ascidiaceihabitans donghaensis TaxID=1510460 RepID=A0A2R8BD12_9RHOB|nr:TauD/TfdA family dioxygenase [Ascidiaceihabitans donghaensis]SPH20956.1 (R)-phenoxypropionate/alpha-ketoglutarate-dioxygenase [Ascidiaceihabitans donghaensis]
MAKWVLRRMSGYCGAMMMGRDLNDMTPSDFDFVKQALFEHGVVVLPDQHLSQDAHIAVAEAFGPIEVNRFFTPVDDHPMIAEVRTTSVQTAVIGGTWHTDHSYDAAPAMCSILSAQKLPPYGGDTHFASMTAAYHGLSPGLGQLLGGLKAWHSDSSFADSQLGLNENPDAFRYPVLHPVVVRHPQTGAPCLYVNGDFTTHFEGWSREESAPLLAYLYAHATQPIFTCRVQWRPGMVAIWDNRLVQHYATADYAGHDRLMHRITVQGVPLSGL